MLSLLYKNYLIVNDYSCGVIKMNIKTIFGGAIAVALVVVLKIGLKVGAVAALFGGSVIAHNAYESRVAEVKQEVARFNETHTDSKFEVDENNKLFVEHFKSPGITEQVAYDLINDPQSKEAFDKGMLKDKYDTIRSNQAHDSEWTNNFLINQGWCQVMSYETMMGRQFGTWRICKEDMN
jgi:hypothetical protein